MLYTIGGDSRSERKGAAPDKKLSFNELACARARARVCLLGPFGTLKQAERRVKKLSYDWVETDHLSSWFFPWVQGTYCRALHEQQISKKIQPYSNRMDRLKRTNSK